MTRTQQTLAIYGSILALVAVIVGVTVATGGVSLDLSIVAPRGEGVINLFADENPRIVVVGAIECFPDGSCNADAVRGAPGLTPSELAEREPNILLSYTPGASKVRVIPRP